MRVRATGFNAISSPGSSPWHRARLRRRVHGRLHERRRACGDDYGARTGSRPATADCEPWSESRVESGHARRRQRRPQCHLHRKPEHREPHCEPVRSVYGNRQDRRNRAGTSVGKQSGANLLAGLHPEFPMACDGPNSAFGMCDSAGGVLKRISAVDVLRATARAVGQRISGLRAGASAHFAYLHHRNDGGGTSPVSIPCRSATPGPTAGPR